MAETWIYQDDKENAIEAAKEKAKELGYVLPDASIEELVVAVIDALEIGVFTDEEGA